MDEIRTKFGRKALDSEITNGSLIMRFIAEEAFVTVKDIYEIETDLAKRIINHVFSVNPLFQKVSDDTILNLISQYEQLEAARLNLEYHLDSWQIDSVINAIKHPLMIITGGPGTGKTSVLKCIDFCLRNIIPGNPVIYNSAPTGKASRRMAEAIGHQAMTIQKCIGLKTGKSNPITIYGNCLIVDEISMLDLNTAWALFKSVHPDTKIILVGDVEQLPSVGFGAILRDMIQSRAIPVIELEVPQRQIGGSNIYHNIQLIRRGCSDFCIGDDFSVTTVHKNSNVQEMFVELFLEKVEKYGIDNVVCLTPYKRVGTICADVLNDMLQERLNGAEKHSLSTIIQEDTDIEGKAYKRPITFRLGDPVIQLVNRKEIANGDVGKISLINPEKRYIKVSYCDCEVTYLERDLNQLNLAYALSIHKSQGSEYKCVISAFLPEHRRLLNRNIIYTAVTRAKTECALLVDLATVKEALKIESGYERITMLAHLIREAYTKYCIMSSVRKFEIERSVTFL
ncbi:MAG: ATP-dependent RecD-like DNA helicase [Lachnospiraceae bacterium]|nr:ATP-dependent RecD-like DNA helicase [Lachnospiraceae bacterium]